MTHERGHRGRDLCTSHKSVACYVAIESSLNNVIPAADWHPLLCNLW